MTNIEEAVKRVGGFLKTHDNNHPDKDVIYSFFGGELRKSDLRTLLAGIEARDAEIERLKNALMGRITIEMHHAAQSAVLEASEAGEMFEDEPFNIVNAIIKTWGFDRP